MNKGSVISILAVAAIIACAVYYKSNRAAEPTLPAATQTTNAQDSQDAASEPAPVQTADASASKREVEPAAAVEIEDDVLDMPAAIGEDEPSASKSVDMPPRGDTKSAQAAEAKRPRLVDLGADKCVACKKLAPILDALREEYKGRLDVEFIDVWKDPGAKQPYNIRLIPTQILYDKDGKEVWRHEGFIAKEDLKALFAEKVGVK